MGKGLSKEQNIEQYLCQYRRIESLVDSHYGEGELMESKDKRCFIVMKEKRFQSLEQLKRTLDQLRQRKEKAHPNLVEVLEYFVCTEDTFCSTVSRLIWVMEYVKKDLAVEIRQRKLLQLPFDASELTQLTYQCISALARLQRDGMLFGDLRSGNILLTNSLEVKLVDPLCEAHPPLLLQALSSVKVPRGTYLAPNLLGYYKLQQLPSLSQKSLHKAEVFALGFILMEACLLNEQDECFDYVQCTIDLKIFQANLDSIQENYGEEIALLIKNMTTFDERSRPTFVELENILNLNSSMNRPLNASHFPQQSISFSKLQSLPDRSRNEIRHSSSSILQGEVSSTTSNRGTRQLNQQDRKITLQNTSGSNDQMSFFLSSETPKETVSTAFKTNIGQPQNGVGGGFIERYSQLKESTESAPRLLSRKSEQSISQKKEEASQGQQQQQYQHRLQLSQSYSGINKRSLQSNESFVSNQENKVPVSDYFQDKTLPSSQKTNTKRLDAFTLGIAALGEHGNSANKLRQKSINYAIENKQNTANNLGQQQGKESKGSAKIITSKTTQFMQQQSEMLYGKNYNSGKQQQKSNNIGQSISEKTKQSETQNQKILLEDLPRGNAKLSNQFQSFYSTLMSSNKDGNNLTEKGQGIQVGNGLTQGQGQQQLQSQNQIDKQEKTLLESFIEKEIENDEKMVKSNDNQMQLTERTHGNQEEEEEKYSAASGNKDNNNNHTLKVELSAAKGVSAVDQLEGDISGINNNSETNKSDDIGRINRQQSQLGKLEDLSEIIKGPDQSALLPFPQDNQASFQKTLVFQEMPPSNTSAFSLNYSSLPANLLNNGSASSIYKYIEETYEDGSVYKGEKFNDKRHGKGRFNYADGGFYEGQWSEGFMEGFGRLYYPSSKLAYEGEWKQDRFTGQGAVYNDTPEELAEGEKFNFSDFNEIGEHWISYEGGFQDDQKQGKGFMILSNGNKIIGSFLHDMVDGVATCIDSEGKQMRCIFSQNKLVQII